MSALFCPRCGVPHLHRWVWLRAWRVRRHRDRLDMHEHIAWARALAEGSTK